MIYDYVVYLKNTGTKKIDLTSILLLIISIAFFLYRQNRAGWHDPLNIYTISGLLIAGGLAWNWYVAVKRRKPVSFSRMLIVAGLTWLTMPFLQWTGLLLIIMALLEKYTKTNLEIGFTHDAIVFNTFFKKRYQWNEFSNILLKDNMLTLDFKNNKLIQKETIDDTGDADEDEFNAYCSSRLNDTQSATIIDTFTPGTIR